MEESQTLQASLTKPSQESKNIALLMWIGTIFFGFIPGLLIYLLKAEDSYLADQSKESLNWSITVVLGSVIGGILCLIIIGVFILWALAIVNVIFCALGALSASKGDYYRVPFALRLIK
jgi:uncharacterized Tic20 family protein